jgi:glutathione S-transferase
MDLYFSPLACSLASRIAFYEAGLPANFIRIKDKQTPDGKDFLAINSRGQVPALKVDDGEVLTENVAILEYIADLAPASGLAPKDARERVRMRKWLALVNSELHTSVLGPMLSNDTPDVTKTYLKHEGETILAWLDAQLAGRTWLLNDFSIADIYLAVVFNWTQALPFDVKKYSNLSAHRARVFARPAAGKGVAEEVAMWREAA